MDFADIFIKAKEPTIQKQNNEDIFTPYTTYTNQVQQTKQLNLNIQQSQSSNANNNITNLLTEELFFKILKDIHKKNQTNAMNYKKVYLSPTDLCGLCPRKVYYRIVNADYKLQLFYPYSELITHTGSAIHSWVQKVLSEYFEDVESEIKIELPEKKLKGYIDLMYRSNNRIVLVEIKTCGEELHQNHFYGKESHWRQVAAYYWIWNKILNKPIDIIQLMYLKRDFKPITVNNKKEMPFKIFTVYNPEKLWNTYKDHILWMYHTLIEAIDKQQVPTIDNQKLSKIKQEECGFCPYQEVCSKSLQQLSSTSTNIQFLF